MWLLLLCFFGDPVWIDVPVLRPMEQCRGSTVLADIESRMPAGHQYAFPSMPMTWAHETTHGLNSRLRSGKPGVNVLYCLNGRAIIIKEPKGRLSAIARLIPPSLRGPSFHLYLVQQQRYWEMYPTYLADEAVSYTNGSLAGRQCECERNSWHYELLQAITFNVYLIAMAQHVTAADPQYDHTQLKAFIGHNAKRTLNLWNELDVSGEDDAHIRQIRAYLQQWRTGTESASLRAFAACYLGESLLGE